MNDTATRTETTSLKTDALNRALLCAQVAEDNNGREIVILDMRGITELYDFFILITGSSRRQIHTIADEIDAALKNVGDRRRSVQGYDSSKWIAQDYGDIVVHVFDEETRDYYQLEELWADATRLDWKQ